MWFQQHCQNNYNYFQLLTLATLSKIVLRWDCLLEIRGNTFSHHTTCWLSLYLPDCLIATPIWSVLPLKFKFHKEVTNILIFQLQLRTPWPIAGRSVQMFTTKNAITCQNKIFATRKLENKHHTTYWQASAALTNWSCETLFLLLK